MQTARNTMVRLRDLRPLLIVPTVVTAWSSDANDGSATVGSRAVCPFCGRGYDEPRQRCTACGGLPVVAMDDRRVYDTVLAECGPGCGRVAGQR